MKTETHPAYVECRVTCSCGNQFVTHATVPELRVELCAECHPFYTGKQKLVDTGGRVERFTRRYSQAQESVAAAPATEAAPKRKKRVAEGPKRKPPVAINGGPRPKYERRPRGEGRDERLDRGAKRAEGEAKPAADAAEAPATDAPES